MKIPQLFFAPLIFFAITACNSGTESQEIFLEERWDTLRPLANPDKGWYHHMLDNGVHKYLVGDESEITGLTGLDHFFIRLAWGFFEPEEGAYDWSYIDDIVEKYIPKGYKVSVCVTCKETGGAPNSVPEEIDGVLYATPSWVRRAGTRGVVPKEFGPPVWTPYWDDPVFMEKLDRFHRAFADRYDGQPWLRYIIIGSIGEWGEGHTNNSTRIPPTEEEVRAHMDLYLKHYTETQLVVYDDLLYWHKPDSVVQTLLDYAVQNNISMADASPMVEWYVDTRLDSWSVSHPHFFDRVYRTMPTVFELQHYRIVKSDGNWLGSNGEEVIPEHGVSGADIFRNSVRLIHPTYISFHGDIGQWLKDNPDLTNELLNLCGYWYFPLSVRTLSADKDQLRLSIKWINKGVAPAYHPYNLSIKLAPTGSEEQIKLVDAGDSGNRDWMPGDTATQVYEMELPAGISGACQIAIRLFDERSGRTVETGLNQQYRDAQGFYALGTINL